MNNIELLVGKLKRERKGIEENSREEHKNMKKLQNEIRETKSNLNHEKDKLKNIRVNTQIHLA